MKTLQNNFTTPEQSKRLLELGVPADSADCYYTRTSPLPHIRAEYTRIPSGCKPCWSVGRLMEIIDICVLDEQSDPNVEEYPSTVAIMDKLGMSYVEYLFWSIDIAIKARVLYFSKLEE